MMSKSKHKPTPFKRGFNVDLLKDHINDSGSLIGALFNRWILPGQSTERLNEPALRLAVRNGYLNFYANGQSVAKLSTPGGRPRIELAEKYLSGPGGPRPTQRKNGYARFEGAALLVNDPDGAMRHVIAGTRRYWSAEKCFVEHLVAANANIIDIEMGLPGDPAITRINEKGQEVMVAPRMDIVLAREIDGRWRIEFWEAKMFNNGELRATLPEDGEDKPLPHICTQLARYEKWMTLPSRPLQVRDAYKVAASKMLALANLAGKSGTALDVWNGLAASSGTKINPRPGIVIGNYSANPEKPVDPETITASRKSFAKHGKRLVEECERALHHVESATCPTTVISGPLPGDCL